LFYFCPRLFQGTVVLLHCTPKKGPILGKSGRTSGHFGGRIQLPSATPDEQVGETLSLVDDAKRKKRGCDPPGPYQLCRAFLFWRDLSRNIGCYRRRWMVTVGNADSLYFSTL